MEFDSNCYKLNCFLAGLLFKSTKFEHAIYQWNYFTFNEGVCGVFIGKANFINSINEDMLVQQRGRHWDSVVILLFTCTYS